MLENGEMWYKIFDWKKEPACQSLGTFHNYWYLE